MTHFEHGRAAKIRDRIEEQSERLIDNVQNLASLALDDGGDALRRARRRGAAWLESGRADVRRGIDGAEELVVARPLQAVLVALGIGLLLGLLFRR